MVCNEVQWSATSCNNRAKVEKVVHNFFCKKITHYQTFP